MFRTTTFALALCLGLAVSAEAKSGKEVVQLNVREPLAMQIQRVEAALNDEEYSEISTEDKSRVQAALSRIRARVGAHDSADSLAPQDKVEVFNDQEEVNTLLTKAKADSRMVCRRERQIGSNMPQNVCMTVAQRREATRSSRDLMYRAQGNNPQPLD